MRVNDSSLIHSHPDPAPERAHRPWKRRQRTRSPDTWRRPPVDFRPTCALRPPPPAPRPTLGHPPTWTAGHRGCQRTVRRRSAVAVDAHAKGGWGERGARALVRNRVTGQPPRASRRRRSSAIGASGIPSPSTPTPSLHQPLFGNCTSLHGVAVGGDDTFALVASSRPFVYCLSRNGRPAPVLHLESPLGTVQRTPPGAVQRTPPRRPTRRYGRPLCPDSLWRLGWPGGAPPGRLDDPPGVMPACQSYLGHPPAPLPNTTLVRVWRPPRRAPRVHDKSTVKGGAASDPVPSHPAYSKNRPQPPPPPHDLLLVTHGCSCHSHQDALCSPHFSCEWVAGVLAHRPRRLVLGARAKSRQANKARAPTDTFAPSVRTIAPE